MLSNLLNTGVPKSLTRSGPDRNQAVRERIVALAQRHRRYGVGMIHLKLRQAGDIINYKRVERLYGLEKLQIGADGARRSRWPIGSG